MGIEKARKTLDDIRDMFELEDTRYLTFRDMSKILDALAEPDKIEKGELKIPKGVQDEWDAEYFKNKTEEIEIYQRGFRAGYAHKEKGGKLPPSLDPLKMAEKSPGFGVGDIVESTGKLTLGLIGEILSFPSQYLVVIRGDNGPVQVSVEEIKLLFPLSRIPRGLKLPNGTTIRCEPKGDIVEVVEHYDYKFGLVVSIDSTTLPLSVLCWSPSGNVFKSVDFNVDEIKRVVWSINQ